MTMFEWIFWPVWLGLVWLSLDDRFLTYYVQAVLEES